MKRLLETINYAIEFRETDELVRVDLRPQVLDEPFQSNFVGHLQLRTKRDLLRTNPAVFSVAV